MNKCKTCGAELIWCKMANTNKYMPLDAIPELKIVLDNNNYGRNVPTYTSHFYTCPDADKFRKDKK